MSVIQHAQASSSHALRGQTPTASAISTPVLLRYERYQDSIPVHSIEDEDRPPLTGVNHYLHMQRQRGLTTNPSLDHIGSMALSCPQSTTPLHSPSPPTPPPLINLSAPSPPSPFTSYASPIYTGKTHNPAIFLAILRIAQHNLPTLDLASATNHIPNIRPTDALPVLVPAATGNLAAQPFLETRVPRPKRDGDEDMSVAFLPDFYDGGERHAVGFFHVVKCPRRGRVLGTALFTPCTEEDLRKYGLVEYVDFLDGFGDGGVEAMSRVGCLDGEWLERDTVEEYEEWKLVYRVASVTWEARMGLLRGDLEG